MSTIPDFIADTLIYALGWTVVHSLWQGMLIALVLAGGMILAQSRTARFRYRLSVGALLLLLVVSAVTFFLHYEMGEPMAGVAVEAGATAGAIDLPVAATSAALQSWPMWLVQAQVYFEQHLPLIVVAWLMGVAFFLLRMLAGLGYVQHLRHRSVRPVTGHWEAQLKVLSRKLKLKRPVQLLESAIVRAPVVIGWLKPVVLIPVGTIAALTPAQVEAVLAHELAHIYRQDYLLNIIQSIIEALFYFNPAVWWISAYVRMERENCCDDMAISLSEDALGYAKALVKIEESSHRHPRMAMAMASKGRPFLLQRVRRILNQPPQKMYTMEKLTTTGLLLAALLFFSFSYAHKGTEPGKRGQMETLDVLSSAGIPAVTSLLSSQDTLPKGNIQIQTDENGKTVDVELKDGEIRKLRIDGREIPASEFPQHEEMVENLLSEMPAPPAPPMPPTAPAPPAPPAAPAPPAPSAAPAPPKAPRTFRFERNIDKKVRTEKRDDGTVIIEIEEEHDGEPMKVIIEKQDGKQVIRIDEELIQMGDSLVVKDQDQRAFFFNDSDFEFEWTDEDNNEMRKGLRAIEDIEVIMENASESTRKALEELHEKGLRPYGFEDVEIELEGMGLRGAQPKVRGYVAPELRSTQYFFPKPGSGSMKQAIEQQMLRDGFIESTEEYKFQLSGKGKLRINGKRMADGVFERYKSLYESTTRSRLGKGDEVAINKKP